MPEAEAILVALADIRTALQRVLEAAEKELGPVVDLDADYYWTHRPRELFGRHEHPEFEAGQLSDDVLELREMLNRKGGEVILWHDLEHLVGILTRISDLTAPSPHNAPESD